MKLIGCIIIALISVVQGYGQRQGIGLRLGEPTGITYKKYLPGNRAIEFGLGSSPRGWEYTYYRNSFEFHYPDHDHIAHRARSTVYLQGRYLIHNPISAQGVEGKFDWYWGVGLLLKSALVEYRYQNENPPVNPVFKDDRRDIDFGPEGIIGVEYTFEDIPLSVYGEFDLLLEVADRRALRFLGGLGIRYNF